MQGKIHETDVCMLPRPKDDWIQIAVDHNRPEPSEQAEMVKKSRDTCPQHIFSSSQDYDASCDQSSLRGCWDPLVYDTHMETQTKTHSNKTGPHPELLCWTRS